MIWKSSLIHFEENGREIPTFMKILSEIPFKVLAFMIPLSILTQYKFYYPQYTKPFVHRFIGIASLNRLYF